MNPSKMIKLLTLSYVIAVEEERSAINTHEYEEKRMATDEAYSDTIFYIAQLEGLIFETWDMLIELSEKYKKLQNTNPEKTSYEIIENRFFQELEETVFTIDGVAPFIKELLEEEDII